MADPLRLQRHPGAVQESLADHSMLAHELHLVSEEAALLLNHAVGHPDDADVVEECGCDQVLEPVRILVAAEAEPQRDRVTGDSVRVVARERITCVEGQPEGSDHLVVKLGIFGHWVRSLILGSAARQAPQHLYRQVVARLELRIFRLGGGIPSTNARSATRAEATAARSMRVPALRVALRTPDRMAGSARRSDLAAAALPRMPRGDGGRLSGAARARTRPRAGGGARLGARHLRATRAPPHVPGASGAPKCAGARPHRGRRLPSSRYHSQVAARPSSSVRPGSQPSSVLIAVESRNWRSISPCGVPLPWTSGSTSTPETAIRRSTTSRTECGFPQPAFQARPQLALSSSESEIAR